MAVRNLTDRFLQSKRGVPLPKQEEYADEKGNGLYAIVQVTGTVSWAVRYRRGGKLRKLTIGQYPALSLKDARVAALDTKASLNRHEDPRAIQRAERARARREEQPGDDSVASWFDRYLEAFKAQKKNRSHPEVKRRGEAIKGAFGDKHITVVDASDIREMVKSIGGDRPIHANRTFETCRAFYNWLIAEEAVNANPCAGLKVKFDEQSRERVLAHDRNWDEFVAIWRAVETLEYPFAPAIRLLMLTGQRRDEVGEMHWKELNGRGEWIIPADRTKNGKQHVLPLPSAALDEINKLPRTSPLVFTTTGKTAISGWGKVKARLDSLCPLAEPWRLHDLRRTFATGLAEIGVAQQVTEALLNHVSGERGGLVGVYNRYQYKTEMRAAMTAWSRFIDVITDDGLRKVYSEMITTDAFRAAINSDTKIWEYQLERMRDAVPAAMGELA